MLTNAQLLLTQVTAGFNQFVLFVMQTLDI